MKLKRITKSKNKLLQLQIIKLCYKKKSYNFGTDLRQIEIYLHKTSDIIYKYHVANKKILFLGFPSSFKEILKNTKHMSIPEFVWFNGMLSNRVSCSHDSADKTSKSIFKLMLKLKKKLDLVVIYDLDYNSTGIKESYLSRIPVITFSKQLNVLNPKTTYDLLNSYSFLNEKVEHNNFIFSFLKATLHRAEKTKKARNYKSLNKLREVYRKKDKWNFRKSSWKDGKTQSYQKPKYFIEKN